MVHQWRLAGLLPLRCGVRTVLAGSFAGLAAAATLSLGLLFSGWAGQRAQDDQGQALLTLANSYIEHLDRGIALRLTQLIVLSHLNQLTNLNDPDGIQEALDTVQHEVPSEAWLGVANARGQIVAATRGIAVGTSVSEQAWFKAGRQAIYVGNVREDAPLSRLLRTSKADPSRFIDMAVPLRSANGDDVGVLVADLDWQWIEAMGKVFGAPFQGSDQVELLIVGPDGTVLKGAPDVLDRKLDLQLTHEAREHGRAVLVERWTDGRDYLAASVLSDGQGHYSGLGWIVIARQPLFVAVAGAHAIQRTIIDVTLICAALFGGVGWILAGWISRPMRRLAETADHLRRGELVEMPTITRPWEMGVLTASLATLFESLTRKQVALEQMSDAAHHDALTGLLNRAGLALYIDAAMMRAKLKSHTLSLLCIDLDGFKAVNDTHGHAVGDQLLVEVAARLTASVRDGDAVARFGGDEFVLVLETGSAPDCIPVMEIVARALKAVGATYEIGAVNIHVGCSIGGAVWPADGDTIEQVFAQADIALYASKREGRGRALVRTTSVIV